MPALRYSRPMKARALAVLFGMLVIAIALGIRGDRREPEGQEGRSPNAARKGPFRFSDEAENRARLLCIEELRAVCDDTFVLMGFAVDVEPAWTTADRVAGGGSLGADVWLTVRPFDQLAQPSAPPPAFGSPTPVLARSPLALAGPTAAVASLDVACPEPSTRLGCATSAGRARQVALRDARSSAFATLALATVAHDLGTPGDAEAVTDPAVVEHLRTLARTSRRSQAPFEDVMRIGGQTVALTVEAEVLDVINDLSYDSQERYEQAALRYPIDVRSVEVVAVSPASLPGAATAHAALQSSEAAAGFRRGGFATDGRAPFAVQLAPPFKGRPVVRTDLPANPALLRDIHRVVSS
ncbi:MAG: hypothetical protein KY447_12880 [Actinobacteria bacterium]|nr:hypothetical protein [Actinomycetota bacterium]